MDGQTARFVIAIERCVAVDDRETVVDGDDHRGQTVQTVQTLGQGASTVAENRRDVGPPSTRSSGGEPVATR